MKLQAKYLPIDYEEMLFEELLLLKQGKASVDEYTKFHVQSIRNCINETKSQRIARYKSGLWDNMRRELFMV